MKLSICKVKRIERETGLMCLDDCIATVAEYYHCGYEMFYVFYEKILARNEP